MAAPAPFGAPPDTGAPESALVALPSSGESVPEIVPVHADSAASATGQTARWVSAAILSQNMRRKCPAPTDLAVLRACSVLSAAIRERNQ
jgi:hypothetical protein